MGLGVISEDGQVKFPLTRMIYMWHTLWGTCLSLSLSLSLSTSKFGFAALRRYGNSSAMFRSAAGISWYYNDGLRWDVGGLAKRIGALRRRGSGPSVACLPLYGPAGAPAQSLAASAPVVQGRSSSASLGRTIAGHRKIADGKP